MMMMKNTLTKKVEEFKLLAFICQSQIEDNPVTDSLESYLKGQMKAYNRTIEMLEGLFPLAEENDYLRTQMQKLQQENEALKLKFKNSSAFY
jgi:translation elongation factor EF-4